MSKDLQTTDLERLSELITALEKAKQDKAEKKVIVEKIMDFFRENDIKTYHYGDLLIRFTDERTTIQFDVEMLQSKYPEIWKECHSEKVRQPHLQIKKTTKKTENPEDDFVPPEDEEEAIES